MYEYKIFVKQTTESNRILGYHVTIHIRVTSGNACFFIIHAYRFCRRCSDCQHHSKQQNNQQPIQFKGLKKALHQRWNWRINKMLFTPYNPPSVINLLVFVVIADGVKRQLILAIFFIDKGSDGITNACSVGGVHEIHTC